MEISSNLFSTEVVYSLEMARSFILQEGAAQLAKAEKEKKREKKRKKKK